MNPPAEADASLPGAASAAGTSAKRPSANDGTEEETSHKRHRDGQVVDTKPPGREGDDSIDEAKSSPGSDFVAASSRQPPLRPPANAPSPYLREPASFLLREQAEQNNSFLGPQLRLPTHNDNLAAFLRSQLQYPAIDPQRFMANQSTSQMLGNLARSDLNRTNLLARQSGLAGLSGMPSMGHPLLQSTHRQDTTQQHRDRLSSFSDYTAALGPGNFRMAAGGVDPRLSSLSSLAQLNPLHGARAAQSIPLPLQHGRTGQMPLLFARNPSATANEPAAAAAVGRAVQLPPIDDGVTLRHSQRTFVPLGIYEDNNWLSELHCLVRLELVEVFRAGHQEVAARSANKRISYLQVGLRCRFCAHLPSSSRSARSSAFPSSIRQIYQSFTMMLRDHVGQCSAMPEQQKTRFLGLKASASQGASHSKHYWNYSAMKLGLVDTDNGIAVTERTQAAGQLEPPFGSNPGQVTVPSQTTLVSEEDRALVNDFLYNLMAQAHLIQLLPSEQIGNRKSLRKDMPGFGCRFCCRVGWLGLSRMFPARRRTLRGKLDDLHTHLKRCSLCPAEVKTLLESVEGQRGEVDTEGEKLLFDQIWARLGHSNASGNT